MDFWIDLVVFVLMSCLPSNAQNVVRPLGWLVKRGLVWLVDSVVIWLQVVRRDLEA